MLMCFSKWNGLPLCLGSAILFILSGLSCEMPTREPAPVGVAIVSPRAGETFVPNEPMEIVSLIDYSLCSGSPVLESSIDSGKSWSSIKSITPKTAIVVDTLLWTPMDNYSATVLSNRGVQVRIRDNASSFVVASGFFFFGTGVVRIIPNPFSMTVGTGAFALSSALTLGSDGPQSDSTAPWIKKLFAEAGITVTARTMDSATIRLHLLGSDAQIGTEGYRLTITTDSIVIAATTTAGQFYAVQTLRQLLPAGIERGPSAITGPVTLPLVQIVDKPKFAFRSSMLDVGRHFLPLSYIYHHLDRMALFKLNYFHFHLTDDQGWRLEVRNPRWADLHLKGSLVECGPNTPKPGERWYYTQDEIRQVIKYAADRKIIVIPEIDMPGHCQGAVAVYPNLGAPGALVGYQNWEAIKLSLLNLGSAVVDTFIADMIKEEADLFPGQYIHIGGDEAVKATESQYAAYVERAEQIVKSYGKIAIGWEEIERHKKEVTTMVQPWQQTAAGDILSWCPYIYLDIKNKRSDVWGQTWCSTENSIKSMYTTPYDNAGYSWKGIEAPLWSERVRDTGEADRMTWPRLAAVAEFAWAASNKDWDGFAKRIGPFGARFDAMGMRWYTTDGLVSWKRGTTYASYSSAFDGFDPTGAGSGLGKTIAGASGSLFDINGAAIGAGVRPAGVYLTAPHGSGIRAIVK